MFINHEFAKSYHECPAYFSFIIIVSDYHDTLLLKRVSKRRLRCGGSGGGGEASVEASGAAIDVVEGGQGFCG